MGLALRRGMMGAVATAAAVVGAMALAAPASADEVPLTLDHVYFKSDGTSPGGDQIVGDGDPVVLTTDTNLTTGDFTVQPEDVAWPPLETTVAGGLVTIRMTVGILEELSGNLNGTTGEITTDETDYEVAIKIWFTAEGEGTADNCTVGPIPLSVSTNNNSVFEGQAFTPPDVENFAITDDWTSLPSPTGGSKCAFINSYTAGEGALWLANGIDAPTLARDCEAEGDAAYDASIEASQGAVDKANKKVSKAKKKVKKAKGKKAKKKAKKALKKAKKKAKSVSADAKADAEAAKQAAIDECESA